MYKLLIFKKIYFSFKVRRVFMAVPSTHLIRHRNMSLTSVLEAQKRVQKKRKRLSFLIA